MSPSIVAVSSACRGASGAGPLRFASAKRTWELPTETGSSSGLLAFARPARPVEGGRGCFDVKAEAGCHTVRWEVSYGS